MPFWAWKIALCAVRCVRMHTPHSAHPRRRKQSLFTPLFFVFNPFGAFWGQFTPLGASFYAFLSPFSPFLTPFCQFWHPFTPFWHLFVTFLLFFCQVDTFLNVFFTAFWSLSTPFGNLFFLRLLTHINPFRPPLKLSTTLCSPYKAF